MIASARFTLLLAAAGAARQRFWFEERLSDWLLREGWRGLLWWQWLAMPIAVALALAAGFALGWLTRVILGHLTSRTEVSWDDRLLGRLSGPITAVWAIAAASLLSHWMGLGEAAEGAVDRGLHAAIVLVLFWAALRAVDFPFQFAAQSPWGKTHAVGVGLLPLGRKVAKVVVVAMGVIAFLTDLGYPVASLLAGLGIGGLALALAAQKTVENLFGSVAIGADQPFRVGDFVRIDNILGTVESVGLRSTRIRTLDRTLVSIPNGKLADMRTETFAPRDRIRLACTLGLARSTTSAQMRVVLADLERTLRSNSLIWSDEVMVFFSAVTASSLDVEVMAWFRTSDWSQFLSIRQEVLLCFIEVVEQAGTRLAFPTQTIQLEHAPDRATDKKGPVA
jgi:MscS family membrane protein